MTFNLDAFRASVTRDFYSLSSFVNWSEIDLRLQAYSTAFESLNDIINNELEVRPLAHALLKNPAVLDVIRTLLAIPQEAIGFLDGRALPARSPKTFDEALEVSIVLHEMGIKRLLTKGINVYFLQVKSQETRKAAEAV
jgi:hypothetical protein